MENQENQENQPEDGLNPITHRAGNGANKVPLAPLTNLPPHTFKSIIVTRSNGARKRPMKILNPLQPAKAKRVRKVKVRIPIMEQPLEKAIHTDQFLPLDPIKNELTTPVPDFQSIIIHEQEVKVEGKSECKEETARDPPSLPESTSAPEVSKDEEVRGTEGDDGLPLLTAQVVQEKRGEEGMSDSPFPPLLFPQNLVHHSGSSNCEEAEDEVDEDEEENRKVPEAPDALDTAVPPLVKPKRKKNKGRNGNIYIGVANRIEWFKLQERFGFDNVNAFGTFVMEYMHKVHEDFNVLHQVALTSSMFEQQGLANFRWVNGLPHPVNNLGKFVALPELELTEDMSKKIFDLTYDLALKRGTFLVELSQKLSQQPLGSPIGNPIEESISSTPAEVNSQVDLDLDEALDLEVRQVLDEILDLQTKMKDIEEQHVPVVASCPEQELLELEAQCTASSSEVTHMSEMTETQSIQEAEPTEDNTTDDKTAEFQDGKEMEVCTGTEEFYMEANDEIPIDLSLHLRKC